MTYLACATLVARADVVEDDDDLQFMRILSANGTNTTATTTTTTAAANTTTTMAPTTTAAGNATTTVGSTETTVDPNATTTAQNGTGSETKSAGGNETTTTSSGGKEIPKADSEAISGLLKNVSNTTNTTEVQTVAIEIKATAKDPFYCAVSGNTTGSCAATTTAAPAGNTTNTTRMLEAPSRMLAGHGNDLKKAHDTFCGAFSFAGAYAVCEGLGDSVVALFTPSTTTKTAADVKKAIGFCVTGLTLASKMGTTNCYQATGATSVGACFGNKAAIDAMNNPTQARAVPGVKACTKSTGTDPAKMEFKTNTDLMIPKWRTDTTSGGASAVTINPTAITAASKTAAANSAAVLKNALIVAAVEISTKQTSALSSAGVDMATELGMTAAQFNTLKTAVTSAGGAGGIDLAELAKPTAGANTGFAGALASASAQVSYAPTVAVTGTGGTTSAATGMMVGVSAMVGFLSLVF